MDFHSRAEFVVESPRLPTPMLRGNDGRVDLRRNPRVSNSGVSLAQPGHIPPAAGFIDADDGEVIDEMSSRCIAVRAGGGCGMKRRSHAPAKVERIASG